MEWKGFHHNYQLLLVQKKDIENGNIKPKKFIHRNF